MYSHPVLTDQRTSLVTDGICWSFKGKSEVVSRPNGGKGIVSWGPAHVKAFVLGGGRCLGAEPREEPSWRAVLGGERSRAQRWFMLPC